LAFPPYAELRDRHEVPSLWILLRLRPNLKHRQTVQVRAQLLRNLKQSELALQAQVSQGW
jgi:hypothetical protein